MESQQIAQEITASHTAAISGVPYSRMHEVSIGGLRQNGRLAAARPAGGVNGAVTITQSYGGGLQTRRLSRRRGHDTTSYSVYAV